MDPYHTPTAQTQSWRCIPESVLALYSRVCAGIKGKQEQNLAIPHCVNAHPKVLIAPSELIALSRACTSCPAAFAVGGSALRIAAAAERARARWLYAPYARAVDAAEAAALRCPDAAALLGACDASVAAIAAQCTSTCLALFAQNGEAFHTRRSVALPVERRSAGAPREAAERRHLLPPAGNRRASASR
jgi:hypothetical protein